MTDDFLRKLCSEWKGGRIQGRFVFNRREKSMCRFPKRNGMIKESYESDGRWVHCGHRNREREISGGAGDLRDLEVLGSKSLGNISI